MKELETSQIEQDLYSAIAHGLAGVEVNRSIVDDIHQCVENVLNVIERLQDQ